MSGISEVSFAELMAQVSLSETGPVVAVAVSGGSDSMALCLLADRWARARDGRVVALTVDHGLRADSAHEAVQVGHWLSSRGIDHHVLTWTGSKPRTRIQEKARDARYDLLTTWCRSKGIGNLAFAHQLEDQAETFVMRLNRGSGPNGLAGMSAVIEMDGVRVIRPLLGVSRGELVKTIKAFGQPWVEDPSNRNRAFERIQIRENLPALAGAGYPPKALVGLAAAFGQLRKISETETAALLAGACVVHEAGFAEIDMALFATAPCLFATHALAQTAACIGGGAYPPDKRKLADLYDWVCNDRRGKSLCVARCRFQKRKGHLIVCRENRGLPKQGLGQTNGNLWDGRFRLSLINPRGEGQIAEEAFVGPLGRDGWAEIVAADPKSRETEIPFPARLVLPAIRDLIGIREVPHLDFRRPGIEDAPIVRTVQFSPRNKLFGEGFCLAPKVSCTIS